MQVKYEMLRQVHIDNGSISESAQAFGFSRPSFYQAQAAFQQDGVFGLLPHKRGPQGGHKLTTEVMEFVAQQRSPILRSPPNNWPQPSRSGSGFRCIRGAFNGVCCGKKNAGETLFR